MYKQVLQSKLNKTLDKYITEDQATSILKMMPEVPPDCRNQAVKLCEKCLHGSGDIRDMLLHEGISVGKLTIVYFYSSFNTQGFIGIHPYSIMG